MMKNQSFNFRLISLISFICITLSSLSAFILYRNNLDAESYQRITAVSLPKVKVLGELLSTFRQVRIEVRSLGLEGNTKENNEQYKQNALKEVEKFEKHLTEFRAYIQTSEGLEDFQSLEKSWKDFFAFGSNILSLMEENTAESMQKLRQDILEVCPVKAEKISLLLEKFSLNAKNSADILVEATNQDAKKTFFTAISLVIGVSILAIFFGIIFASKISRALIEGIEHLYQTSNSLDEKTNHIREASRSLSDAVQGHATGLQQTASAINEISAMVSRNADNAKASVLKANSVTVLAQESKDKVTLMKHSISEIADGNSEILKEIADSNREINNIANIITEISNKTQVINDIVFQTKLLSFNASVEAARAGEHGKGFTVVAQEIGNLANMSGKAATEINDMLKNSVQDVENILQKSEEVMKRVSKESLDKMGSGLRLAEECDSELSEVLVEIAEVHQMIRAISEASSEQETGVKEINRTMNELDSLTQGNASISVQTSRSAEDLEEEARTLTKITHTLREVAFGGHQNPANVIELKQSGKVEVKEVIGL